MNSVKDRFVTPKTEEHKKYPRNDFPDIKGRIDITRSDSEYQNDWRAEEEKEDEEIRKVIQLSIREEEQRKMQDEIKMLEKNLEQILQSDHKESMPRK